jgi:hypothetical protein
MRPNDFRLERYFAKFEFSVNYRLGSSDCESLKATGLSNIL